MQAGRRGSSLRVKTLVIIASTALALVAALALPVRTIFLGSFLRLEEEAAARDLGRAVTALRDDVAQLHATTRDYAAWDDTYAFLGGDPGKADYATLNFVDETFAQNRLSLVLLASPQGKVVFAKALDLASRTARPPPAADVFFRAPGDGLLPREPEGRQGVIETPDGPMMVAAYPVLTSTRSGPPRGVLIMGRALDAAEVDRLARALRLAISITPVAAARASPELARAASELSAQRPALTRALDEDRLGAYALVQDVAAAPLLILRVELPRDIYRRGLVGFRYLLGTMALAGLVFGLAIFALLERFVLRQAFGRYVSEDVARSILDLPDGAKLGGETREVTILFSDVRDYSTISEKLHPSEVVDLLNEYFGAMSDVIDRQGGCVIEFLGDAILAVFGAPGELPDHAERAVRAALQMQRRGAELNRAWEGNGKASLWKERGIPALASRIGVHTGRVVAGNLGSKTRMKYAVIGDAVNAASRVEHLNNTLGTDLLFTEEVRIRLPPDLVALARDAGEHPVKGRGQPVHVFTLRPE